MEEKNQIRWKEFAGFGEPGCGCCEIMAVGSPGNWEFWSRGFWDRTWHQLDPTRDLEAKADAVFHESPQDEAIGSTPLAGSALDPESSAVP